MAFKLDSLRNARAQTRQFGRDSVKQLQALRRSSGRNKAPRKIFSREKREASRSRKSRRSNSGRVDKQQQQLYTQVTNPRNWYHQDIVKNLLEQLADLNEKNKRPTTKENTLSEATMYNIQDSVVAQEQQLGNIYGKQIKTNQRDRSKTTRPLHSSSSVAELIEKHVLRDITRHLIKRKERASHKEENKEEEEEKKIHEEESASGMKVVITKTPKQDTRSALQLSELSSASNKFLPPFAKQGWERRRLRKPARLRSERISLPSLNEKPTTLTAPAKLETKPELPKHHEDVSKHETKNRSNKPKPKPAPILVLPQINEETDSLESGDIVARGRSFAAKNGYPPYTAEKSTNTDDFNNLFHMLSPPEVTSDSDNKVKLPILGKSIGTERYPTAEIGSKRAYFREVRKMIHGLYGEYFEPPVETNFTYESQLVSHYEQMSRRKSLNYITPTLQEDCTAGSYTLQLYHSAQSKPDEAQVNSTKSNKMSIPVIRNKYGQTIAMSKKKTTKKEAESQTDQKFEPSLPLMLPPSQERSIYKVIHDDYLPRITPNTPDSATVDLRALGLHEQFARQVSLYRDQVAKEQAYLNGIESDMRLPKARHVEQSAYDGVDIDLYLEIKHRKSLERRLRLKELKRRNREHHQQHNSHLEVVEQRQKFLSLLNRTTNTADSKQKPMTSESVRTQNLNFEYYHDKITETPIAKIVERKDDNIAPERHGVNTKIYRIFAERKNKMESRERENPSNTDKKPPEDPNIYPKKLHDERLPPNIPTKPLPRFTVVKPPMSDLVSRFPVATRYKLDREYVKALASSST